MSEDDDTAALEAERKLIRQTDNSARPEDGPQPTPEEH